MLQANLTGNKLLYHKMRVRQFTLAFCSSRIECHYKTMVLIKERIQLPNTDLMDRWTETFWGLILSASLLDKIDGMAIRRGWFQCSRSSCWNDWVKTFQGRKVFRGSFEFGRYYPHWIISRLTESYGLSRYFVELLIR